MVPLFGDTVHMRSSDFLVVILEVVLPRGVVGEVTAWLVVAPMVPDGVLVEPPEGLV